MGCITLETPWIDMSAIIQWAVLRVSFCGRPALLSQLPRLRCVRLLRVLRITRFFDDLRSAG